MFAARPSAVWRSEVCTRCPSPVRSRWRIAVTTASADIIPVAMSANAGRTKRGVSPCGVATTAGGIKLLRAYALFNHGRREMERLVRPSSISGAGARKRGLRREGAQIAWVFVMLFLVSMATAMLALSLTGLEFETALAASIAAFSNAGPVFTAVNEEASWLTTLTAEGRAVIIVAMALGRVELLALIAMINPDNWR